MDSSLWRSLADGSAGWVVRLLMTLCFAALVAELATMAIFGLAVSFPDWNRGTPPWVYPSDDLAGWVAAAASLLFLVGTVWLWSRNGRWRLIWKPMAATLVIAAVAISFCVILAEGVHGAVELLLAGVLLSSGAAILFLWVATVWTWRRVHPQQLRMPELHCPQCGYRMAGLYDSRCPECGTRYTLEELVARQTRQSAVEAN